MDKFSALWLSHSSISTFKSCPRAYYLANIYRDPRNHHKLSLISPPLALGAAVHSVLESLSRLPTNVRFQESLIDKFELAWSHVTGIQGGFDSPETEAHYKNRGADMLRRIMAHPGPLLNKAVKIKADLPYYWLSEPDNLILCGKIDWLEYLPAGKAGLEGEDAVHIIDFKTGVGEEKIESLQLPIYHLLAHNCQTRPVAKASYWYIARDEVPLSKPLPDLDSSTSCLIKIGKQIKLAKSLHRFKCPKGSGGCNVCTPYEKILAKEATFVGVSNYGADVYTTGKSVQAPNSEIL
ncbi:MAG: PD-(D/E)XK nuclease family protein [bacterium]